MTDHVPIRYETSTIPVTINGPCPECGRPFQPGQSVTFAPLRHRHCDPISRIVDQALTRDLETLAAQLDKEFDA